MKDKRIREIEREWVKQWRRERGEEEGGRQKESEETKTREKLC